MINATRNLGQAAFQHVKKNTSKAKSPQAALVETIAKDDPDKAQELLRDYEQAVTLSNHLKEEAARQKKEAALREIEQIKREIQMLRLLAMINPKAAARRAAQLGKKLANAAKQYADGMESMPVTSQENALSTMPSPEELEKLASQAEEQAAFDMRKDDDDTAQTDLSNEIDKLDPLKKEELLQQLDQITADFNQRKADGAFFNDVKMLQIMLKNILESAKKNLQGEEYKEAKRALNDLANIDQVIDKAKAISTENLSQNSFMNLNV